MSKELQNAKVRQWSKGIKIMANKTSAITKCFLIIISAIPFFILALSFNNLRFVTLCFIWVGTILLIEPAVIFEAFREIHELGSSQKPENDHENIEMLKKIYEYLVVFGGFFLVIVGLVATFTM